MMRWLVFNSRMDVIGTVFADGYTAAFIEARRRFRDVDYIQEIQSIPYSGGCGIEKVWYNTGKRKRVER